MATTQKNHWRVVGFALVGLALVGTGLSFAGLSNPKRFPVNAEYDRYIHLFAVSGFVFTLIGVVLFLYSVRDTTKSMPPHLRTKANIGIGLGIFLQLAGFFLPGLGHVPFEVGLALILGGLPAFVWGGIHYAEGKGQSRSLGLLATLGLLGLVLLVLLPHRQSELAASKGT